MIAIIMVLIVLSTIGMAKARRRRRRWTANMQKVNCFTFLALLNTAANALVKADLLAGGDNEFRLLSIRGVYALRDLTAGEGPLLVGVAHSDYTEAEIEEYLENETQLTRGDLVATREISRRLVRRIGIFGGGTLTQDALNDGKPIHTRLNWPMATGDTLTFWVLNMGSTLTTGAEAVFTGNLTIKWT